MPASIHADGSLVTCRCCPQVCILHVFEVFVHGLDPKVGRDGQHIYRVSSVKVTRPAKLLRLTGQFQGRGSSPVGSGGYKISIVGSGWIRRFSKLTGRVLIFQNLAGWLGSCQGASKLSHVGSDQVNTPQTFSRPDRVGRPYPTRANPTRPDSEV